MSSSIYRGRLHTNSDIRGVFTEAEDKLEGKAFDILVKAVKENKNLEVSAIGDLRGSPPRAVYIMVSGLVITIDESGSFEIAEGAA